MTGMYASIAVLAALNHRERTGEGQYIDMALLDVQVAMLANMNMNFLTTGQSPKRWGNAHANIVPYQTFATATATSSSPPVTTVSIVSSSPSAANRNWLTMNASPPIRHSVRHRDILVPVLADMVRTNQTGMDHCTGRSRCPCGPINQLHEVFDDPQVKARNMEINMPHPAAGEVKLVASPMRLSETPVRVSESAAHAGSAYRADSCICTRLQRQQITALSGQTSSESPEAGQPAPYLRHLATAGSNWSHSCCPAPASALI
jgi:formyl-CoA transferase